DITGFRDWNFSALGDDIIGRRFRDGYDIGAATAVNDPTNMTAFDRAALERDEQFNTRISGYIGWQQAARKLIPTPRPAAQCDLTPIRSVQPFTDATMAAVRGWEFVPADDEEHRTVPSRVLVGALFRAPSIYATPGDVSAADIARPSNDIPYPLGTVMPVFPPL